MAFWLGLLAGLALSAVFLLGTRRYVAEHAEQVLSAHLRAYSELQGVAGVRLQIVYDRAVRDLPPEIIDVPFEDIALALEHGTVMESERILPSPLRAGVLHG